MHNTDAYGEEVVGSPVVEWVVVAARNAMRR
jgi:hypothetical protein